jgi:hypothetical protein
LTASASIAAAQLILALGKWVRHQGGDVARQFIAIAAQAVLSAGCV